MNSSKIVFIVEVEDSTGEFQPTSNSYFHVRMDAEIAITRINKLRSSSGHPAKRYRIMKYQRVQNHS